MEEYLVTAEENENESYFWCDDYTFMSLETALKKVEELLMRGYAARIEKRSTN